jgi:hypothetical protein
MTFSLLSIKVSERKRLRPPSEAGRMLVENIALYQSSDYTLKRPCLIALSHILPARRYIDEKNYVGLLFFTF